LWLSVDYNYPRVCYRFHIDDVGQFISTLSGETYLLATALSADGQLIVGTKGAIDSTFFRWTENTGIVDVGKLEGALNAKILAVN
jgi:hypothetical protein